VEQVQEKLNALDRNDVAGALEVFRLAVKLGVDVRRSGVGQSLLMLQDDPAALLAAINS
jgi:hypothetical protein